MGISPDLSKVSEATVAQFAASLAGPVIPTTVRRKVSHVAKWLYQTTGKDIRVWSPNGKAIVGLLGDVLQGIDKRYPHVPKVRQALTIQMLPDAFKRIHDTVQTDHDKIMWKAIIALMVHTMVRPCEILSQSRASINKAQQLTPDCLQFRRDGVTLRLVLDITLKKRKTSKNAPVQLPTLVQTLGPTCPVMAMSTYMTIRETGYSPKYPVFISANGEYVTRQMVTDMIKQIAPHGGDTTGWSAYSTRIGGTTSLASVDCTTEYIKRKGGWKSDTYLQYISGYDPEYDVGVTQRLDPQWHNTEDVDSGDYPSP